MDKKLITDSEDYTYFAYKLKEDLTFNSKIEIELNTNKGTIQARPNPITFTSKEFFSKGETIYVYGTMCYKVFDIYALVDADMFELFKDISPVNKKLNHMRHFSQLTKEEQEKIKITKKKLNEMQKTSGNQKATRINDVKKLQARYEILKDCYTSQQQRGIEELFSRYKKGDSRSSEKVERKILAYMNIDQLPDCTSICNLSKSEIEKQIRSKFYGQEKAIRKIIEKIIASKTSAEKGFAILLKGSDGTGKNLLVKIIAEILEIDFYSINFNALTSDVDLTGDNELYDQCQPGFIGKYLTSSNTTRICLLLENLDGIAKAKDELKKASSVIATAAGSAKTFFDNYFGIDINTKDTVFFATCESTVGIPSSILESFDIIELENYTTEDKCQIASTIVWPDILQKSNLNSEDIIFENDVFAYAIEKYTTDFGMNETATILERIKSKVVCYWDDGKFSKPFFVNKKFVDELLINSTSNSIVEEFKASKHLYSEEIKKSILEKIQKLKKTDLQSNERNKLNQQLEIMVNFKSPTENLQNLNIDSTRKAFDEIYYGNEDIVKDIFNFIKTEQLTGRSQPICLLLNGAWGTGKTFFAECLAKSIDCKLAKLSLNGISHRLQLRGTCEEAGRIILEAKKAAPNGIFLLDEIEKTTPEVITSLCDLLEHPESYYDEYLSERVDLSGFIFIGTTNDVSKIDPAILSRFTCFNMKGYTENEKCELFENFVIPAVNNSLIPKGYKVTCKKDIAQYIVENYSSSTGIREVKKLYEKLLRAVISNMTTKTKTITKNDINEHLGKPHINSKGNVPEKNRIGLAKGLAVAGNMYGTVFAVDTMLVPSATAKEPTITGLAQESVVDSVKKALAYIQYNYPETCRIIEENRIYIDFSEGGVKKDGPSAGVTILISLLSALLNKKVRNDVAYTGEISLYGDVFAIGGEIQKIDAARKAGCKTVFIPKQNFDNLSKDELKNFPGVEVVGVSHVSEVISKVFDTI